VDSALYSIPQVATFTVGFLGCKVSHVDAREIGERLAAAGHVEAGGATDVAVLSTCCVTREAVKKSRKAARQAARRASRVYVTGCAANLPGAFSGLPDNVRVVALPSEATGAFVATELGATGCAGPAHGHDRVRAFVKVQDGCSFSCAFCIIPRVRGASRSRPAAAVLAEVRRRVAQGHREVVLTGINLGCYRDRESGFRLPRLVREAGATAGLARLRLSSVEVNHVSGELLRAMRETPPVSAHLHVPLQSGDDRVLRAMGRRYTASSFLRRLEAADGFNLTTDAIVGFPGEDERAFERTLETVERAGITKVHVFPYSPRPGTQTEGADTTPPAVKRERSARLREASRVACIRAWRRKLGSVEAVLVDRPGQGYGDDYSPWLLDAPVGDLARVRAVAVTDDGIVAG
jgi:threonylcarbamoyladenosine tRNA methylthiotransferase MtaB